MLVVDDEAAMRSAMSQVLTRRGYAVETCGDAETALSLVARRRYDAVISDLRMPGMDGHELLRRIRALQPKIAMMLVTAYGTVESAVRCVRDGASDYLLKPFSPEQLIHAVEELLPRPEDETRWIDQPAVVAEDPRTAETVELALRAAAVDATVLIEAESGAGKEVIARLIHRESARADGPFVAVNCAAFPKELLEAELFGHSRGAFTGATRERKGHFQVAHGGTLLLDEIGEMGQELQSRLLRVMQDRIIQPIGYDTTVEVDVRIIAATNRNLREEVARGRFREDLYYRLRVFPICIPPLRERPADIEPLVLRCARRHAGPDARITSAALRQLVAHSWPGNVRELENVIQRAAILSAGEPIDVAHLDLQPSPAMRPTGTAPISLEEAERDTIRRALAGSGGNRQAAAAALGISARTLRHKLKRFRDSGMPVPEPSR
jgi:two-component system response regulator FlrC